MYSQVRMEMSSRRFAVSRYRYILNWEGKYVDAPICRNWRVRFSFDVICHLLLTGGTVFIVLNDEYLIRYLPFTKLTHNIIFVNYLQNKNLIFIISYLAQFWSPCPHLFFSVACLIFFFFLHFLKILIPISILKRYWSLITYNSINFCVVL